MTKHALCPHCKSVAIRKHCPSKTCDLIICSSCHHYGTLDGRLWQTLVRT